MIMKNRTSNYITTDVYGNDKTITIETITKVLTIILIIVIVIIITTINNILLT